MNDVLDKIRQLHALLEEKLSSADKKVLELREVKERQDDRERKQNATAIHLSAKERVISTGEKLKSDQDKLEIAQKELAAERNTLAERIKENMKLKKELSKELEETKKSQALFIKKRDNLEIEKEEIARREKVKQGILAELRKGI